MLLYHQTKIYREHKFIKLCYLKTLSPKVTVKRCIKENNQIFGFNQIKIHDMHDLHDEIL